MTTSDRRIAKTLRNCRVIAALVCCAFGWLAILTFDPTGWPNPSVWPFPNPVNNGGGRAGAWIAYQLFYYLGGGTYLLAFLLALAALLQLARQRISDALLRFAGLCLLITATAAAAALIFPHASAGLVEGRGGILGIVVASSLQNSLSTVGAALTVAAGAVIGLLLMADDLLVRIPATVSRIRQHGIQGLRAACNAG
ncbi:MAG: DNA translocase FtsK 4TM domain-containing protein, partial [Dehalococcoidia bacterium]